MTAGGVGYADGASRPPVLMLLVPPGGSAEEWDVAGRMPSSNFDRPAASAAITNGIVGLHREFFGRGARTARTYIADDTVFCLMEDIFTPAERTLIDASRLETVRLTRLDFQDAMKPRFIDVVESATGRTVVAFMSQVQENGYGVEFFVTAAGARDDAESSSRAG